MTAADKIASARALIEPLSIHRMLVNGRLEDPSRIMAALADLADAMAQENAKLKSALRDLVDASELASDHDWPEGQDPLSQARAALSTPSPENAQ